LAVEWHPETEQFSVRVDEGSVLVGGPYLGAAQQVVSAGERCSVDLPRRTMLRTKGAADGGDTKGGKPLDPAATPATNPATYADAEPPLFDLKRAPGPRSPMHAPTSSWTSLEEKGDYDGAHAAAHGAGLDAVLRASSADELLRLAQVGQLSGHRATERAALLSCRRRFPKTEQASVAAYELGRASSPSEGATWFEAYLRERPAGPLAREASGRLLEARVSAGDEAAARDQASRYLAQYPDGPQARLARRVLESGLAE
jgi:hypothetical protein